jgi:hypothetical protein
LINRHVLDTVAIQQPQKAFFLLRERALFVFRAIALHIFLGVMFVYVALNAASASEKAADILKALTLAEAQVAAGMKAGDASALWIARRAVNRAGLVADMADAKPDAAALSCMQAVERFRIFANAAIDAFAFATLSGPEAADALLDARNTVDDEAGLYLKARQTCADGSKIESKPGFTAPLGAQFTVLPIERRAMDNAERRQVMLAAMAHFFEAERQITAALDGKSVSSIDPAFGKAAAALFAFGFAQAPIPKGEPDYLPCRRLGGLLGQMLDMAAASVDTRFAQGKNFDLSRWPDAISEFDFARSNAELRKRLCTDQLGLKDAQGLLIPEKLLDRVKAP